MTIRLAGIAVALCGTLAMAAEPTTVRWATYNIQDLTQAKLDALDAAGVGQDPQLRKAAAIIQQVRPAILLVNEIDYDFPSAGQPGGTNAAKFRDRYLRHGQFEQKAIDYPHIYFAPVNTGVPSGLDLNNNGKTDDPEDAFGYGKYPGQYGMALFSQYPLDVAKARTFQLLLWQDVPGHLIPDGQNGRPAYYTPTQVAKLRLSSKSHWDVPVQLPGMTVHALCAHPTPPVFDGPEDRNGRRNHDELRLWVDYLTGGAAAKWIKDDAGQVGGLPTDAPFVLLGDLNAEPVRGDLVENRRPIDLLIKHARVHDPRPKSLGAEEAPGQLLMNYKPFRTHDFGRLDYVLPSHGQPVRATGVFWPQTREPGRAWIDEPHPASDHRLVWLDLVKKND